MPAALEVDHEKIKMVALEIGVREAARQYGLSEAAVMQWSKREKWFAQKELANKALADKQERQGLSAAVSRMPSDVLKSLGDRSKLRAAKVGDNTLKAIGKRKDEKLVSSSGAFLNTVNALSKVHGWGSEGSGPSLTQVNVNLHTQSLPDAD